MICHLQERIFKFDVIVTEKQQISQLMNVSVLREWKNRTKKSAARRTVSTGEDRHKKKNKEKRTPDERRKSNLENLEDRQETERHEIFTETVLSLFL